MTATTPDRELIGSALEASTVLRRLPSPRVEWVDVEGEIVAWNEDSQSLHLLDSIAALIFQLLDGVTPLGTTAAELADVFSRDVAEVAADVLTLAASLQEIGIVEVVR